VRRGSKSSTAPRTCEPRRRSPSVLSTAHAGRSMSESPKGAKAPLYSHIPVRICCGVCVCHTKRAKRRLNSGKTA
jgi:hypothetical protein